MRQTTRFTRLLIAGAIALALAIPIALPQPAHARSAALPAHGSIAAPRHATARAAIPTASDAVARQLALMGMGVTSGVPITLQVPAGNVAYLAARADGVQIYTCNASGQSFAWSSAVPGATLYNGTGGMIATHFAGPTWQASDGSSVLGHKIAAVTVAPDSIPWLLLGATSTTVGPSGGALLSGTSYIQRLLTRGGLAPAASACNAGTAGTTASIPYSALYVFYAPIVFTTSASSAAVGQSITVTGTNFQPNEAVQVYWDVTGTTPLATGTADGTGTFVASVTIPAGLVGAHTLLAIGQTSGASDFATMIALPRLVLMPVFGAAGTQVVATGDGFGAAESVNLTLDSLGGTALGSTSSDALGSFGGVTAVTFTVPLGTPSGVHLIYAAGQSSGAATVAAFLVH